MAAERDIQNSIKRWLEDIGATVSKYNASGYGISGHPDLFVSVPHDPYPIALYIEVKTKTGNLSMVQKIKVKEMVASGCLVLVARSVQDVKDWFDSLGIEHL